jgi:alpha-N-arabinofuranosidase
VRGIIDGAVYHSRHGKKMKIAFDEWNATYSFPHEHPHHQRYTLEDALVVGMFLNAFIRHADAIKIANMAQLVNIIPPIFTSPEDMFLQTIFYPLELYTCENGTIALDAYCDCETFETNRYGKVSYLDISASFDADKNRICINVINRHLTDTIPVTIENQHGGLADKGIWLEINGEDIKTVNDFKEKANVITKKQEIDVPSNPFVLELPPHSISMVQVFVK